MALYRVEMRFASDFPGQAARKWRNTYYHEAPSAVSSASAFVVSWTAFLRPAVRDRVYCYEVYATDLTPATADFAVVAVPAANQRGAKPTAGLGEPYLPKACIAVTLSVPGSRPSRKFFRPGLMEQDVVNGVSVGTGFVDDVVNAFNEFVSDLAPLLVDPDAQEITGVQKTTLTTRNFGREAGVDVPLPPPLG